MNKIQNEFNLKEKKKFFKIKNKFIFIVISLIIGIILFVLIRAYSQKIVDRDSYAVLLKGNAQINKEFLVKDIKNKLSIGDNIRTIGESSMIVLEWGDGSITRLGGDSSIKINELYVSNNKIDIKINFELLSGKTWSNIISFLGEGSYFKEKFRDSEAAVRGTVFNVDLKNKYLEVKSHKLNLTTPEGKIIEVTEKKPLNIDNFSFIHLEEFIQKFKNIEWEKINLEIDNSFIDSLKKQAYNDLDKLIKIKDLDIVSIISDEETKKKIYNEILESYQKLNFITSNDSELFFKKIELKESLLIFATDNNKKELINSTIFDFKDILDNKNFDCLNKAMQILSDNKKILPKLDLKNFFKNGIIPDNIKKILQKKGNNLKNIFGETFNETMLNPLDTIKNIEEKGNDLIHGALDSGYEKINNLINK